MTDGKPEITPSMKVHDLLTAYPELEDTLIAMAPPFKKLKNPVLRNSVAKVATLKHISSVANIPLNDLITKLRDAVGQAETDASYEDENYLTEEPDWFSRDRIRFTIDENKLEDSDRMTLSVIIGFAKDLKDGEIIELITSFLPAPGIDTWKSKGHDVWTVKDDDGLFKSYFLKTG